MPTLHVAHRPRDDVAVVEGRLAIAARSGTNFRPSQACSGVDPRTRETDEVVSPVAMLTVHMVARSADRWLEVSHLEERRGVDDRGWPAMTHPGDGHRDHGGRDAPRRIASGEPGVIGCRPLTCGDGHHYGGQLRQARSPADAAGCSRQLTCRAFGRVRVGATARTSPRTSAGSVPAPDR